VSRSARNGGLTVVGHESATLWVRGAVDLKGQTMTRKVMVSVKVDVAKILWIAALIYLLS
jgi:hypothetical protein